MPIRHAKTVTIPDPTQADLDAQIALGNYPPGTLLADISLTTDWNDDHVGGVESVEKIITQNAHGFSVAQAVYYNGSAYALARADSDSTADVIGIISAVTTNTFTIVTSGAITLSGLTPGMYFLSASTAGLLTLTPPSTVGQVRKPLMSAVSATEGFVNIDLGITINTIPATTFDTITSGTNTSATMTVGSGASIVPSGTGIIQPSTIADLLEISNTTDFAFTGAGTDASPYAVDFTSAMKGSAASVTARLKALSTSVMPISYPTVTGNYYDQGFDATARTTLGMGTGQLALCRFIPGANFTIDQLAAYTTVSGGTNAKIVIYDSDANGWPNALIKATASLVTAATSPITESYSYTFLANNIYWIGIHNANSGVTYRALALASLPSFGNTSISATSVYVGLSRTVTYASGPPNPWNYTSTDLYSTGQPCVLMRAA
jgi:hypothetical protein